MAKKKSQCKKGGNWFTTLCVVVVVLAVIGGIVFGIIKGVEHFKPVEKPDAGQTEQKPETPGTGEQTPEEQIATANVNAHLA